MIEALGKLVEGFAHRTEAEANEIAIPVKLSELRVLLGEVRIAAKFRMYYAVDNNEALYKNGDEPTDDSTTADELYDELEVLIASTPAPKA